MPEYERFKFRKKLCNERKKKSAYTAKDDPQWEESYMSRCIHETALVSLAQCPVRQAPENRVQLANW